MSEEKMNVESSPDNQQASRNENSKHGAFVGWVKNHKKVLIISGTVAVVGIVVGISLGRNWSSIADNMQALISPSNKRAVAIKTPKVVADVVEVTVPMDEIVKDISTDKVKVLLNGGNEFSVRRHPRTLPKGRKASQLKITQAASLGIELEENQTWVIEFTKNCA